jgi:alpha/beta superfamily hydrolase
MNNNVVCAIVVWFQRLKITTMRFDFCGSQLGRGTKQVDQVKEASNFLLEGKHLSTSSRNSSTLDEEKNGNDAATATTTSTKVGSKPPKHVLLVGYSYGSIICASASASIPRCIGVAMISPPLAVRHWLYMFSGNYHLEQARQRRLPLLMMIGSEDNFTSEEAFYGCVHTMPQLTTTGAVLKGADHFFRGREKDLMDVMGK